MRLLLDTHIWLWSQLEPQRISPAVARELSEPGNELWLSPVSVWEALLLAGKGRVWLDDEPLAWVRRALDAAPVREAPLTFEVVYAMARIDLPHRDPADRFLAATAYAYGLTLVTADRNLSSLKNIEVLVNR